MPGDDDHRHRVHLGGGNAGYEVGGAWPRRCPGYARLAGDAGVAVGGVGGALLVAHEDVPELRVLGEGLVERQNGASGEPEDYLDALPQQALTHHL